MKTIVNRLVRDEKGAALVLVLILLLISGLIIGPLLSYMGTGLITGKVYETRTDELYAADAGAEDAIWKIQHQVDEVKALTQCYQDWTYIITDADGGVAEVNDKGVEVTITLMTIVDNLPFDYRVVSTATGDGIGTEIDAYIIGTSKYVDYSGIMDQVITSQGDLNEKDLEKVTINYTEGHEPVDYYGGFWPTADDLADWYWEDVKDETPYDSDTIDINGVDRDLGPLYRIGELEITNSSNTPATLTLTGTIYITGDTLITPNKEMTLDLNGQTIFVASNSSDFHKALWIGGKVTIEGPGVIIAVGDIYFEPNIEAGMTEPIFIMSVEGTTILKPSGSYYGAIAGSVEVEVFSGADPIIVYPEEEGWYEGFNFPIGDIQDQQLVYSIYSWEVIRLSPEDLGG